MAEALVHPPCRPATEHIRASVQQHEPSYALHGDGQDGIHPPGIQDVYKRQQQYYRDIQKLSDDLKAEVVDLQQQKETAREELRRDVYKRQAKATTRTRTRSSYLGNSYMDTKNENTVNQPDMQMCIRDRP